MPREGYYLPTRNLVNQNQASVIERANVPRSKFIGSWTRKTAFSASHLVPFLVDEILPGDHMTYNVTAYIRMATPLFPILDNQEVHTFFFYVPNRILWTNWVKFMGEQTNPTDSIAYTVPTIELLVADMLPNTIFDHMGLPVQFSAAQDIDVNALPFRAYNKIWNAWFRDENVDTSQVERTGDSGDVVADYVLARRRKQHDYFTSCLPWPQKFTAPATPLSGTAPIIGIGIDGIATHNVANNFVETGGGVVSYPNYWSWNDLAATDATHEGGAIRADGSAGNPLVFADLSAATGVTINAFRQAFMIQTLLERDARGGTRYTELIRSHFGVINPDFRLQRPEYIGGGITPIQITPVAQTAPTEDAVLGTLGAAGTAAGQHRASYAATEHGYIIGLINIRTELSYQQGLHKMWSRSTRYDFYWPALAQLGEQAVLTKEIYSLGDAALDDVVFGYQERWQEYRTRYSDVTGYMRSEFTGTLDAWHLSQRFSPAPTLSAAFLKDDAITILTRVLAAGALAVDQQYYADILIKRTAVRAIPTFGTPATLGRF